MSMYRQEHFDNDLCEVKWESKQYTSDFFDIRYKGKKWTQEEISKDGEILPAFKDWMMFQFNNLDFDWTAFINENDISGIADIMKNTNDEIFRLGDDDGEENCLYVTSDGGLGIKCQRLMVRYTHTTTKTKKRTSYNDSYKFLYGSKAKGFFLYPYSSTDDKYTFHSYDFDGEKFTVKK